MGDFSYKRYAREYSPALFQFVSPEAFEKLDMMEKDIQPSQATVLTCCEGCAEKHTHITSSHRKFRYAEFILWFTTFFAVSLLLTFLGRLGLCILFFLGDLLPMLQIISRQLISRTVMAGRTDWIFARRDIHHQMPTITKGDQMMIVICFMRSLFSWDSILSPPWQSPLTLFLAYFQSTQNIVIKAPGWYRYV